MSHYRWWILNWLRWRRNRPHPSQFWNEEGKWCVGDFREAMWEWRRRRPRRRRWA